MLKNLRPAIVMTAAFTLLTGLAYPLGMTALAQLLFPRQANGSLVVRNDRVIGSTLVGQAFAAPRYFHGRPSATTASDPQDPSKTVPAPYAAATSGGSNLGPTSKELAARVDAAAARLRQENPDRPVPVDLVTTSASGLDPDITPAAAIFQVRRVAKARGLPEATVLRLVADHTQGRIAGLIGEPRVNVLELNLALDALGR